jgi:hypothetical protein
MQALWCGSARQSLEGAPDEHRELAALSERPRPTLVGGSNVSAAKGSGSRRRKTRRRRPRARSGHTNPDLDTTIVGTINPEHLQTNLDILQKGPLPPDLYEEAKDRLAVAGSAPRAGAE